MSDTQPLGPVVVKVRTHPIAEFEVGVAYTPPGWIGQRVIVAMVTEQGIVCGEGNVLRREDWNAVVWGRRTSEAADAEEAITALLYGAQKGDGA